MLALGLITTGYGFSQTSVWRVSKGDKKIYLGGSVHMLRTSDFPLPSEFDVAFSAADVLVLEADVKAPDLIKTIMTESMLPEGKTLKSVLTEQQYQAIETAAGELGMPMAMIERMKPGMALMSLQTMVMQSSAELEQGVDMYYYDRAGEKDKTVEFLEGIDFQVNLICNTPFDLDEFIKYSTAEVKNLNITNALDDIVREWRTGKATAEKEIQEMTQKYPSVYKAMFADRNYKWMPKIEKYLDDDKIEFVLVGAAHLWGKDGLLTLLKKKGYSVGQLRVKSK